MTETSGGSGRAEWVRRLIARSLQDEDFRRRLLDDPRGILEQELGEGLPEGVEVSVVEESPQSIYLVLPSVSAVDEGVELSDRELEEVAGGGFTDVTCWGNTCGSLCLC